MFDLGMGSVVAVWIWVNVQWKWRGSRSVVLEVVCDGGLILVCVVLLGLG